MCPMRARTWMRRLLVGLGILLASVPLGMFVAVMLFPFWRWLEESTGIELGFEYARRARVPDAVDNR